MIDRTKKFRPAPGGISIGHYAITAGTLGCWVKKAGEWMMLSNNHVLANVNAGKIGDSILQPGVHDGGSAIDEIGKLYEFIPISYTGLSNCPFAQTFIHICNSLLKLWGQPERLIATILGEPNKVDCAIAKPNQGEDVLPYILEDNGDLIGTGGEMEPELGLWVKKNGRTTGTTYGEISQVDVSVNVNMGDSRMALFVDQFMVTKEGMCAGGDSGSVVLTEDNKIVGLLFAGSDQSMVANRFSNVREALGIEIG